ncbi:MAG: hypothetical protein K6E86_08570 [Bacteroidales bacterium]|nr:hypothetical protein [Bacteroidales bacterium]
MLKFLYSFLFLTALSLGVTVAANRPLALEGSYGPDSVLFRLDLAYDDGGLIWGTRTFVNEEGEILNTNKVFGTYSARLLASDLVGYMTINVLEFDEGNKIVGRYVFEADECDNYKNKTIHRGGYWSNGDVIHRFNEADIVVARPMLPKPNGDELYRLGYTLRVYRDIRDTLSLKNNRDIIYESVSRMQVPAYLPTRCQQSIDTLVAQNTEKGLEAMFKVVTPDQWYPHTVKVEIDSISEGPKYVSLKLSRRLYYRGSLAELDQNYYTYSKETGLLLDMKNLFVNPGSLDLQRIIIHEGRVQLKIDNLLNDPEYTILNPSIIGDYVLICYRKGEREYGSCRIPVERLFGFFTPIANSIFARPRR